MLLSLLLFSSQKVRPDLVIPLPRAASDVVWSPDGKSIYIGDEKGVTEWPSGRFVKAEGKELLLNSSRTKLIYPGVDGHELTLIDLKTFHQEKIRKDYKRAWWWGDRLVLLRTSDPAIVYKKCFVEVDGIKIRIPGSLWVTCGDGPVLMAKKEGIKGGFLLYRISLPTGNISKILEQSYPVEPVYSGDDKVFWDNQSESAFISWTDSTVGDFRPFSFIPNMSDSLHTIIEGIIHKNQMGIVFMEREYGYVGETEADIFRLKVQDGKSRNWKVLASWINDLAKGRSELPWYSDANLSDDGSRVVWQESLNGQSKLVVREIKD